MKWVNWIESPRQHGHGNNETNPGNPDEILYPVEFPAFNPLIINGRTPLLHAGSGTYPATHCPAEKQREKKEQTKVDKAASNYTLHGPIDDNVWREVVEGDWEG